MSREYQEIYAQRPDINGLLRNDLGRGVLNAMKAGIAAASGELVLITMADGSDEVELVGGAGFLTDWAVGEALTGAVSYIWDTAQSSTGGNSDISSWQIA